MTKLFYSLSLFLVFVSHNAFAQHDVLKQKIEEITAARKATVGVSLRIIETNDTLSKNGNEHYPMQSVFKFHVALAVMSQVEKGRLQLSRQILIAKKDLLPNTWSPMCEKYPNGNVKLPLSEIIKYTVAQSDNNGCDILIRLLGGAGKLNDYIHSIGVKDFEAKYNEEEMHKTYEAQFSNWTTPKAATDLLVMFYTKKFLSPQSFEFLYKVMLETTTGNKRIRALLPKQTPVADKTGTSGTRNGITTATNDIGIITLPNGKHLAISVFVTSSKETAAVNEKIIADIAKAAYNHFVQVLK